jgi:hypothetical protein
VRDAIGADALEIPIAPPGEPQLELVVDDGDNGPLALEGITAVFAELPWIYFVSPGGAVVARYGDAKLPAPQYDLEAARATITASPASASWRPQPPVTIAAEPEGLPMPDTGRAIATQGFGYVRDIPQGAAGLIAVPLDAAVMAHSGISQHRFRDLRVIDSGGSQIPYLLELRDEPLIVEVALERRDLPDALQQAGSRRTSYVVKVPYAQLPNARLMITTRARVFQRSVTLALALPATERQAARLAPFGTVAWTHADQSVAAPTLSFPLPDSSSGELFVLIEEGDNQPLPIEKATVLMPAYAVRLFRRPNSPLRLMYGRDDLSAPQYDLQLLAPQLFGRTAEEVTAGPEQPMAGASRGSGFDAVPPVVFWSVLGVAVVVLLALVARLMKRESL